MCELSEGLKPIKSQFIKPKNEDNNLVNMKQLGSAWYRLAIIIIVTILIIAKYLCLKEQAWMSRLDAIDSTV